MCRSHHATALLNTLLWLQKKIWSPYHGLQGALWSTPATSLTYLDPCPLAHCPPDTLAYLSFTEHAKHTPSSEASHCLFIQFAWKILPDIQMSCSLSFSKFWLKCPLTRVSSDLPYIYKITLLHFIFLQSTCTWCVMYLFTYTLVLSQSNLRSEFRPRWRCR